MYAAAAAAAAAMSLQSCLTLCNPMDSSPPGSPVAGILQARVLEWVAILPPVDLPDPRTESVFPEAPASQTDSLPLNHLGSPYICVSVRFSSVHLLNCVRLFATP